MGTLKLITEGVNLNDIGQINFTWDFDEEEFKEWLEDNSLEESENTLNTYIHDYVEFDLETFDNVSFHHVSFERCDYNDLKEDFGPATANKIVNGIAEKGEYSLELSEFYNEQDIDIKNPDELNKLATQLLPHGEYYKNCRGFILTNGTVIYTPLEHNNVSIIKGIRGTYDFLRYGNIRVLNQSIDLAQPPTPAQREVLRTVISSYANEKLFLDIFTTNGETSASYTNPDWRFVLGEIDRFFREGIKPQGKNIEESHNKQQIIISETQYQRLFKESMSTL